MWGTVLNTCLKLTVLKTIMKSGSFKRTSEIKIYRSYKKFELKNFNRILKDKLENLTNHYYVEYGTVFLKQLNKHKHNTTNLSSAY